VFLGGLDQTVVVTALPSMVQDLDVPFTRLDQAAWIVSAYLIGYTVSLPLVGRVADRYGHLAVYVACLALFALTSVACGAAGSLEWLVGARGVQALGGGAVLPVALGLLGSRGSALSQIGRFGMLLGLAEAGGVVGPLYGALILSWLDWRWIFYLNVPLVALLLGLLACAWRSGAARGRPQHGGRVDYPGALLAALGLGLLTFALSGEAQSTTLSGGQILLAVASAVALAGFVIWQVRAPEPLLNLRLLRRAGFAAANAANFFVGAALIVAMVDIPLWLATVQGGTAVQGGLLLLRMTALIPPGAWIGGLVARRVGIAPVGVAGALVAGLGLWLASEWGADVGGARQTLDLVIAGFGFGLVIAPVTASAVEHAGRERAATAAAWITVMRVVGMVVALAALTHYGLGLFHELTNYLALPLPQPGEDPAVSQQRIEAYQRAIQAATLAVFRSVFTGAALCCLAAAACCALLRPPTKGAASALPPAPGVLGRIV
jgi:MFS family permease